MRNEYDSQINELIKNIGKGKADEGVLAFALIVIFTFVVIIPLNALPVAIMTDLFYGAIEHPRNIIARGDSDLQLAVKILVTIFLSTPTFFQAVRSDIRAATHIALNRYVDNPKNMIWLRAAVKTAVHWVFYLGLMFVLGFIAWHFNRKGLKAEVSARWYFDSWLVPAIDFLRSFKE